MCGICGVVHLNGDEAVSLDVLELMTDKESGALNLDFQDEIIKGACITRDGEIVHEGAAKAAQGS